MVPIYIAPNTVGSSPAADRAWETRRLMDSAAFSVKVNATTPSGGSPSARSLAMRYASVRDLPEPAHAKHNTSCAGSDAAAYCSGVNSFLKTWSMFMPDHSLLSVVTLRRCHGGL